jgi:hypothetical protein
MTTLQELEARVSAIDAALAKLDSDYADISANFELGGNGALRQAAGIELKVTELRRERALATAATARIQQQQRDQAAAAEQAAQRQRANAARGIAVAIMALQVEIDAQLKELAERCARRSSLLAQLAANELVEPALIMRLSARAPLTRAACHHGLHRFVELQTVSPQGMIALADSNALLAGIGREPSNGSQPAPPTPAPHQRQPVGAWRANK